MQIWWVIESKKRRGTVGLQFLEKLKSRRAACTQVMSIACKWLTDYGDQTTTHTHTHAYWELQVGNDTICLWFQLSNMRTLTPSEREQCNLVTINCMLKLSHGPAVYLVQGSTDTCEVREYGLGSSQWGLHWPCLGTNIPFADACTYVWLSCCFLWLSVKEACWTGWEREKYGAGRQAGRHSSSLTTGN